jgi:hypothetical protein
MKLLSLAFKALLIAGPAYIVAFFTDKMIYVIPTLAATLYFASNLSSESDKEQKSRIDDDAGSLDS